MLLHSIFSAISIPFVEIEPMRPVLNKFLVNLLSSAGDIEVYVPTRVRGVGVYVCIKSLLQLTRNFHLVQYNSTLVPFVQAGLVRSHFLVQMSLAV